MSEYGDCEINELLGILEFEIQFFVRAVNDFYVEFEIQNCR